MRRARPVHLMLAAGIAACLAAPLSVSAQDVAIAGATLIDGNGGPAIPNAVVVIHGDRISAVGARGDVSIPGDATVIDAAGRWVVPGFFDTNVHLSLYGGVRDRYETLAKYYPRENEIVLEAILTVVGFYFFLADSFTAKRPFISMRIFRDWNFSIALIFMFLIGIILLATMALVTPFIQNLLVMKKLVLVSKADNTLGGSDSIYQVN